MRRNCEQIAEQGNRNIYIDSENADEIYALLANDTKLSEKFRHRIEQLKLGIENRDAYDKLSGYDNLWEIRLFKQSKGRNHRIYCKQINTGDKVVHIIIVEFFLQKKSKKIPKEIHKRLKKIESYEYQI